MKLCSCNNLPLYAYITLDSPLLPPKRSTKEELALVLLNSPNCLIEQTPVANTPRNTDSLP